MVRLLLRLERRADRGRRWSTARACDREFTIKTAGRRRSKQNWHYPSRTECMVCHSRAANYVLGLSELQMNKDHDYGGVHGEPARACSNASACSTSSTGPTRPATRCARTSKAKGLTTKEIDDEIAKQHGDARAARAGAVDAAAVRAGRSAEAGRSRTTRTQDLTRACAVVPAQQLRPVPRRGRRRQRGRWSWSSPRRSTRCRSSTSSRCTTPSASRTPG